MGLVMKPRVYMKKDKEEKVELYVKTALAYIEKYQFNREKKYVLDSVVEYYEGKNNLQKAYPYLKILQEQTQKEVVLSIVAINKKCAD